MNLIGRKQAKIGLAVVVGVIAIFAAGFQISKARTFQFFGEIVPRVNTQQKIVALTFDDGPTPGGTDAILAILNAEGVRATFFLIGAQMEQHPDQARKLVAAGHELGNHSYSHDRMVFKSPAFIKSEIERTDELIRQAGHQGPIHFRPPFGKKLFLLPYFLSKHSRKSITWDVEPESFPEVASEKDKIVAHTLANTRPGSIILLHVIYESRAESLNAVREIIAGLKKEGYEFKTVSELLATVN